MDGISSLLGKLTYEDVQKLKLKKIKVGGFNKDDINNFWNEDLSKFDNIE